MSVLRGSAKLWGSSGVEYAAKNSDYGVAGRGQDHTFQCAGAALECSAAKVANDHRVTDVVIVAGLSLIFCAVLAHLTLPYVPLPTGDAAFERNLFKLEPRYYPFPLAPMLMRAIARPVMAVFAAAGRSLSSFDALAISQMFYSAALIGMTYAFAKRLSSSRLISGLAAILIATSAWTAEYVFVASHATVTALAFVTACFAAIFVRLQAIKTCEGSERRRRRWDGILVYTTSATSFAALPFVSSSGTFWLAVAGVWLVVQVLIFTPTSTSLLLPDVKRGRSFIASSWRPLCPAFVVLVVAIFYWLVTADARNHQFFLNAHMNHLRNAPAVFHEQIGIIPFTLAQVLLWRAPLLAVGTMIIAAWSIGRLIFARRSIGSLAERYTLALAVTVLIAYGAGEFNPFTKLARSYFPLLPLLAITTCMGFGVLLQRLNSSRLRSLSIGALGLVFCGAVALQMAQIAAGAGERFSLYHYLHDLPRGTQFWRMSTDPHASGRMCSIASSKGEGVDSADSRSPEEDTQSSSPHIAILGPGGRWSGRSLMQSCMLPDFDTSKVKFPDGSKLLRTFPFPGYYGAFRTEEEVCENLYLRGLLPDRHAPEKQVQLWLLPADVDPRSYGWSQCP